MKKKSTWPFLRQKLAIVKDCKSLCRLLKESMTTDQKSNNFTGLLLAIEKWNDKFVSSKFEGFLPQICKWANRRCRDWKYDPHEFINKDVIILEPRYIRHILANVFLLNLDFHSFPDLDLRFLFSLSQSIGIEKILCWISYFYQEYKQKICPETHIEKKRMIIVEKKLLSSDSSSRVKWQNCTESCQKAIAYLTLSLDRMEEICSCDHYNCNTMLLPCSRHTTTTTKIASKEEIIFACHPEVYIYHFLQSSSIPSVVILIKNIQRYSNYRGYKDSFAFLETVNPVDHHRDTDQMMMMNLLLVEKQQQQTLDLLHLGFTLSPSKRIATSLMMMMMMPYDLDHVDQLFISFLHQLCAAEMANVHLICSMFGDKKFARKCQEIASLLYQKQISVQNILLFLKEANDTKDNNISLLTWFHQRIQVI